MPSPNDQLAAQGAWLRRQLAERGWTAEDLVQHAQAWAYRNHKGEIGMTRSYVSEWLSGKRGVSVRYAEILAGVLNVSTNQFIDGRASQAGKLDDVGTRRDFLRVAADAAVVAGVSPLIETLEASQDDLARVLGTARLGRRRLERLEHAAERYARLYSSSSPAAVGLGIRDHFRAISAALAQSQPAEHQRRMLVVSGRLAGLMSWLCYDLNRQALSLDYLDQGIEAADQANDPVLGAYLRASANRVASFEGDHRGIRDLGLAALDQVAGRSDVSARMLAWFHALVARGRSGTGDLSGTEAALSAAEHALGAGGRPPHGPELAFFDDTRLLALAGECYVHLRQPHQARIKLEEALTLIPAELFKRRASAEMDLARAFVQARQVGEGRALAKQPLALNQATPSGPLTQRARDFTLELTALR